MSSHSSGAGTPGPIPALPAPALTADDVRAWLALRGMAAADMDDPDIRIEVVSLEGCTTDRQLQRTLGWIRDKQIVGMPTVDPAGVTIASLLSEVAAATAAMAPPAPKPPSRIWKAVLWCLGFFSWALNQLQPLGRRAVTGIASGGRAFGGGIASAGHAVGRTATSAGGAIASGGRAVGDGIASGGQAIGRKWKLILSATGGLALLAGLVFGGLKGWEWWQTRALEAAQTPPSPPPTVVVTRTPKPPPVVVIPTPEPPPVVVAPTPAPVIPGPTGPAIYHSLLDMECLMYGRLQACSLPPGCTEGFLTNPPRLQVTCPGEITYVDAKSMTEYPANKRVSVTLHRQ